MTILEEISQILSIDIVQLNKYISTCPYRYKVYYIPKRNNSGVREIAQPTKELKFLQKMVCDKYLNDLPVHDCCKAYKKKTSIRDNALPHVKSNYLLKMDFKNFFPSIRPKDLLMHINKHLELGLKVEDMGVFEKLFFFYPPKSGELKLSIGAPTSPFISNTIMYEFDEAISNVCKEKNIIYTRYADDLSFSTNKKNILFEFVSIVADLLKNSQYPKIQINHDKTVFLSRKQNMHITGLVLTNDGKISIGRSKKRYIKSLVYKYKNANISDEDKSYLSGYLSFCISVESSFIASLELKYGADVINRLLDKSSD